MTIPSAYILPFLSLVLLLITLVTTLDCVWRTRDQLAGFIRMLAVLVGFGMLQRVLFILDVLPPEQAAVADQAFDFIMGILWLSAIIRLSRVIRSLHRPHRS